MKKTFLDSGVLLKAWRSKDAEAALSIMADGGREFFTSQMVKLELLPKAQFFRKAGEREFYDAHFERVKSEEPLSRELGNEALQIGKKYGLAAADALNVAAAIRQGVQEFITVELPGKPMFRVPGMLFTSIHS